MKIWRIETLTGVGPYQAGLDWQIREFDLPAPSFMHDDPDLHPHPAQDGFCPEGVATWEYWVPSEMSFGFSSENALMKWFFFEEHDAERMEDLELCVREFEVDAEHVVEGHSQTMFRKDLSVQVAEWLPTEYIGIHN